MMGQEISDGKMGEGTSGVMIVTSDVMIVTSGVMTGTSGGMMVVEGISDGMTETSGGMIETSEEMIVIPVTGDGVVHPVTTLIASRERSLDGGTGVAPEMKNALGEVGPETSLRDVGEIVTEARHVDPLGMTSETGGHEAPLRMMSVGLLSEVPGTMTEAHHVDPQEMTVGLLLGETLAGTTGIPGETVVPLGKRGVSGECRVMSVLMTLLHAAPLGECRVMCGWTRTEPPQCEACHVMCG